eukprot:TRINITY_DN13231_c0_g1_i4.p1 TRINITY_DN13231_c0_g1~~TRINITY_DN13231_c0_g1_i4.p1  ORF type:complete len:582 (-),score=110.86 TRINITY_DN13231_c0_g1_i4:544-2289(-)
MRERDPCSRYRQGRRNVSKDCLQALWLQRCSTHRWLQVWTQKRQLVQDKSYTDLLADLESDSSLLGARCISHSNAKEVCSSLELFVDKAADFSHNGFLSGLSNTMRAEDLIDALETAHRHCKHLHIVLSLLISTVPDLFESETLRTAEKLHIVPAHLFDKLKNGVRELHIKDLLLHRAVLSAMRTMSEAPYARMLRRAGLGGVAGCSINNFRPPACGVVPRPIASRNASLIAAFYQHRDPGLPLAMIEEMKGSAEPFLRVSGLLAEADRRRNEGRPYLADAEEALTQFRRVLARMDGFDSAFPVDRPPTHLVWHLLDKLSMELKVPVTIKKPSGSSIAPVHERLHVHVVPDRDPVAEHVRQEQALHCPAIFRQALREAVDARADDGAIIRIVEVGGYMGDCALWATAWLGPRRVRVLEVEPVSAATSRLQRSVKENGFEDVITVLNRALGDGRQLAIGGHGATAYAQPAFGLRPCKTVGPVCKRLLSLDEVLKDWAPLASGAAVDLLRIKVGYDLEVKILEGGVRHLNARRVKRMVVQSSRKGGHEVVELFQGSAYPTYGWALKKVRGSLGVGLVATLKDV